MPFLRHIISLLLMIAATTLSSFAAAPQFVYFGTYTRTAPSKGIYVSQFSPDTGKLTPPTLAAEATNPTFLARHPTLPILYAVASQNGNTAGTVTAYKISPDTGALTLLNQVSDGPTNSTYIAITPDGRTALTAHYTGGYLNSFSIRPDGSLSEHISHIEHTLTGTHKQQNAPHPHCIDVSPDGRFALVADLASDRIYSYRITETSALTDGKIAAALAPESGTRHLAFTPDARRLYAINELAATVTAFNYNPATAELREIETISIVPPAFTGRRWASEITVHPTLPFLYVTNRADDESLVAYAITPDTGKLIFLQRTTGLAHPRHFAISPDGHWLLCASHDTNTIDTFRIDTASGRLSATKEKTSVPTCVCIVFWPAK